MLFLGGLLIISHSRPSHTFALGVSFENTVSTDRPPRFERTLDDTSLGYLLCFRLVLVFKNTVSNDHPSRFSKEYWIIPHSMLCLGFELVVRSFKNTISTYHL